MPAAKLLETNIRFPPAWRNALKEHAESEGSDISTVVRAAVSRYMRENGIHPSSN